MYSNNHYQHGDRITVDGVSFCIDTILHQDYYGPRSAAPVGSDWFGGDVEFKDRHGNYHHWKQNQDGGTASRWNGREWKEI